MPASEYILIDISLLSFRSSCRIADELWNITSSLYLYSTPGRATVTQSTGTSPSSGRCAHSARIQMKQDCIDRICRLPIDLKKGNKSVLKLATDSQFPLYSDQVNILDIKAILQINMHLIDVWKLYSEDKRTTGGYFFISKHIGAMNNRGETIFQKDFPSDIDACAEYILREVSSILDINVKLTD